MRLIQVIQDIFEERTKQKAKAVKFSKSIPVASMQVCKFTIMRVCIIASMNMCEHAIMNG